MAKMSRIPLYNFVFSHSAFQRVKLRISSYKALDRELFVPHSVFHTFLLPAFKLSSGLIPLSSDSYHLIFS